ncbi:TetR family transcriptional regulator [Lacisediminihabitans sp. FW035]
MPQPETVGARSVRHTRDDVVSAALGILDTHGLPDLTMRRLGATLDVQPSALYWHFANKQTLLASIADRIVERARPVPHNGPDWKSTTRDEAYALRDALLAFRDGAEVVSSTLALGLGADLPHALFTDSIGQGGFDPRTSGIAASALLHFVLGHVSHEQQRLQADSLGVVIEVSLGHAVESDPTLLARESFDFGITLLLAGLEVQRHAASKPA